MQRRTFLASIGAAAIAVGLTPTSAQGQGQAHALRADAYTWKNAVINGGGFVPGIIFNETEPNLIYARTDIGGCYRWQQDSRTWKPLLDWVGRDTPGPPGSSAGTTQRARTATTGSTWTTPAARGCRGTARTRGPSTRSSTGG
jgi:hypothetical protein